MLNKCYLQNHYIFANIQTKQKNNTTAVSDYTHIKKLTSRATSNQ